MKKNIALILLFILSLCVLGGCDVAGNNPSDATVTEAPTESIAEDVTANPADTGAVAENTDTQAVTEDTSQTGDSTAYAKPLVETEEFAVVITDCTTDADAGFTMNAYLENKTDTTLEFKVTASALNNKDMHPDFSCDVKAGESLTAPMTWTAEKLSQRRLTEVKEVKIELQVISYGDEVKLLSSDIYTINP